ncbi:MAG: hypothetical protein J2P54_20600, partial [Bradyrhizobiaceae bacterium]|nr:hypothetical protein [Bradyrhizobiaceae bacterium]
MKPKSLSWFAAAMTALVLGATPSLSQDLPPTEPILRIETGMHSAPITRIGVDATCRLMVTGSDDKTARLWAVPESGVGEPQLMGVLRAPIGLRNEGIVEAVALSPDGRFAAVGAGQVYIFDTASGSLMRR